MDDDLRPTMARFGNVTKNVKEAQKLLKITIDATAGSGKSQTKIANAVAKAYGGNTTALKGMFPELLKSKDVLGDFAKTYEGMAEANADPFMKFNNSMDILKEKLGVVVLPLIIDFIDEISKEGGAIEVVGKFFDDLANPKSDVGKTFTDIKDAVGNVITGVKDFFALFGNGDAVKGFGNIAKSLIEMLPALLALKGIMMLASAGKSIANLAKAIGLMTGANAVGGANSPIAALGKNKLLNVAIKAAIPLAVTFSALQMIDEEFTNPEKRAALAESAKSKFPAYNPGMNKGIFVDKFGRDSSGNYVQNNVTINAPNADPKAIYTAWTTYLKQNGGQSKFGKY